MRDHANLLYLFRQLLGRELASRYRSTALGTLWLLLQPLLMLVIYTLVFSGVFKARWDTAQTPQAFALMLFAGLIIFNCFSEVLVASPSLVTSQPNYVKKVVFPIAMLAVVRVAAAVLTAAVSLLVLLVAQIAIQGLPSVHFVLAPLVILTMVPFLLGVAWLLSALGVYLRDISQFAGLLASVMLFLSPIFFPASAMPSGLKLLVYLNPLVVPIEHLRQVTVHGGSMQDASLLVFFVLSSVFAYVAFRVFRRLSGGFADVL